MGNVILILGWPAPLTPVYKWSTGQDHETEMMLDWGGIGKKPKQNEFQILFIFFLFFFYLVCECVFSLGTAEIQMHDCTGFWRRCTSPLHQTIFTAKQPPQPENETKTEIGICRPSWISAVYINIYICIHGTTSIYSWITSNDGINEKLFFFLLQILYCVFFVSWKEHL